MGYELDRLMAQFGVGSPSLSYSGISKPIDPGAFSYTAPAEGTTGPTETEAKSSWQALLDKYNADLPTYAADQTAYQAFKPLYSGRIASTPQYLQSQFQTWKPATSQSNIQKVQAWLSANPMAPDYQIKAKMAEFGLDRQDLFNSTGNYWGNTLTKNSPAGEGGNTEGLPSVTFPAAQPISPYADVSKAPVPLTPPAAPPLPVLPAVVTPHDPVVPLPPVTTQVVPPGPIIEVQPPDTSYIPPTARPSSRWTTDQVASFIRDQHLNSDRATIDKAAAAAGAPQWQVDEAMLKLNSGNLSGVDAASQAYQAATTGTAEKVQQGNINRDVLLGYGITPYTDPATKAAMTDAYGYLTGLASSGQSAEAKRIYNEKQASLGFTDRDMAQLLGKDVNTFKTWGYSRGGAVKTHFGGGGLNDMADQYGVTEAPAQMMFAGADQPQGYAVPQLQVQSLADMPGAQPIEENPVRREMLAMLNRPQQSAYGEEYKVARERSDRETQAFQDMIAKAVAGQADSGPSKSEMYFRLAAAFGAPTKTGGIGETLGNTAQVLSEYNKEQRTAKRAGQMQALQLGLQGQQARMTSAKDEASQLRQLTGEELKTGQADKIKLLDYYMKALEPQSPEGKAARDKGLIPGTADYQAEVGRQLGIKQDDALALKKLLAETARGNTVIAQSIAQQGLQLRQDEAERKVKEAKRLTPTELKLKSETEDMVNGLDASLTALGQAYKLNPNTFDNSLPDIAQRKILEAAGSKDPKVINTRLQDNLLQEKALAGLKAAFGGNPTEGERAILLGVQGIGAKSREERKQIMLTAAAALKTKRMQQAKRLNEINQGLYRDTTPAVEGLE